MFALSTGKNQKGKRAERGSELGTGLKFPKEDQGGCKLGRRNQKPIGPVGKKTGGFLGDMTNQRARGFTKLGP